MKVNKKLRLIKKCTSFKLIKPIKLFMIFIMFMMTASFKMFKILRKILLSLLLLTIILMFMLVFNIRSPFVGIVKADSSSIVLDGNFYDWSGMPHISSSQSATTVINGSDDSDDLGNNDNNGLKSLFQGLGYYADSKYLYLYVQRKYAQKNLPWHFAVIILNPQKNFTNFNENITGNFFGNTSQFDINLSYPDNKSNALIEVSFKNELIEGTFSASNNAKELEFRIPLSYIGLDGPNKEIKFILKSDPDKNGTVYWMPLNAPVIMTTGPTMPLFISILLFLAVSLLAAKMGDRKMGDSPPFFRFFAKQR